MSKLYNIKYDSHNEYAEPVNEAIFNYLVTPCNDETQTLIDFSISHSSDEESFYCKNTFGFEAIRIRSKKPFKIFSFSFSCKVQKLENTIEFTSPLSYQEQLETIDSRAFFIDNHLYLTPTPYTLISPENIPLIFWYKRDKNILEYLTALNKHINSTLSYAPDTTTVYTKADEVIQSKKGVCQDFTHLFIAMARKNGIPCRYVSGYLDQGSNFIGTTMMHAWVEAFVPGSGWLGFDPTNNLWANHHYVKVAHGIDYNDCSPLKGILNTKGENNTSHQVTISQQ